ncbi:hypothetical protein K8B83_14635 [Shewanella inventionis]|uniref:hypothetical protein n=1 Tax=Shewanella inventionis TaxID=1738770 RepID=UPI001CC14B19|nr:hypothetical protein [Shewanella inventionis]UAL42114.1 hypothetical protein K8B83_14635 [Shewanella inventionis]
MPTNTKKTSSNVGSNAAKILQDDKSSQIAKKLAASALSQIDGNKQTSSEMETLASKVLTSAKYNEVTKELAASVLAQSKK